MQENRRKSESKTITRREFIKQGTAMGLSLAAATSMASNLLFPVDAKAASLKLTMFLWAGGEQGTVARETWTEYLKTHDNVEVEYYESSNTVTYPKMRAAKKANPNKPFVNFGYFNVDATNKGDLDDMWHPISEKRVPNMKDVYPANRRPGNKGVGMGLSPIGLAYNTDKVKEPPTSWADLWANDYFKGRVILFDYLWPYTGVLMASRLNGGNEENADVGFETWSKHTDQILALVTSTAQGQSLIAKGDAWLTVWAKGNIQQWKDAGVPVEFVVPKEGMEAFPFYFQIVNGSTPAQVEVAEDIINMLLDPVSLGRFCDLNGVAPVSDKVKLPARMTNDPAFQKENLQNIVPLDYAAVARNDAKWRDMWDRMVKAKL
jgi:putative spermidine/putrescine transport system substrate-binding protein